jgi:mutator protein MutT
MPVPTHIRNLRAKIGHEMILMSGVLCVVINDAGEVLAQRRSDDGQWCLPGGIMEPDEAVGPSAEREVVEETGVQVAAERLIAVYSGYDDCLMIYHNQDTILFTDLVVGCRPVGGQVQVDDDESLEVRYFEPAMLPISPRQIAIVQQALRNDPRTHFRINEGNRLMGMSEYVRKLREKIGHDLIFMSAASGVVINDVGEILLQRRSDDGRWALPGGAIDPGEEPADAVIREVWEETGVTVLPERIISVESGPDYFVRYPNGDEAMVLAIVFACKPVSGEPHINDEESLEVGYFPLDAMPELSARHRKRVELALRNDSFTHFNLKDTQEEKSK